MKFVRDMRKFLRSAPNANTTGNLAILLIWTARSRSAQSADRKATVGGARKARPRHATIGKKMVACGSIAAATVASQKNVNSTAFTRIRMHTMISSRLVRCSRCRNVVAYQFDSEPLGPLYCIGCESAERGTREKFEADAAEYRKAANAQ